LYFTGGPLIAVGTNLTQGGILLIAAIEANVDCQRMMAEYQHISKVALPVAVCIENKTHLG
jgi:hypothetical protein